LQQAHELSRAVPGLHQAAEQAVRQTERFVEFDARLPAILRGDLKPASAEERIELAQTAKRKRLFLAAARFYKEAFAARPALAEPGSNRYDAACYAALAGCGQGEDGKKLTAKEQAQWRKQSLDWLRAELARMAKQVAEGKRQPVRISLRHWKRDRDLIGVRDASALAKLPVGERPAWRTFWADVDALLARAETL
jgi:hypothetical protein